jgi:predicted peroxiredoxin
MKLLIKSAWGSDDPTKAAFPFLHANAFAEAGHEAQIFLLGEAVSLMRTPRRERHRTARMAAASRDPGQDARPQDPDPRLNRVLTGPWGPGRRPGW